MVEEKQDGKNEQLIKDYNEVMAEDLASKIKNIEDNHTKNQIFGTGVSTLGAPSSSAFTKRS